MTTQIKLLDEQMHALQVIARSRKTSLDEIVQQAVAAYLEARRAEKQEMLDDGFGLWGPGEDGLAYQERIRSEW